MNPKSHVIVVGAGIIGASFAWHLAKSGHRVTIIAHQTGGVATPHSFSWINASWGNAKPYALFRMQAMEDWHRVHGEIPGLPISFNGSLSWDMPQEKLEAFVNEHAAFGYKLTVLDRKDIALREPNLANPPDFAVHAPDEGALEPDETARLLVTYACKLGASVHTATVTHLLTERGMIIGIVTSDGTLTADHVVVAAGAGSVDLAKSVGVNLPLETPAGLLIRTSAQPPLINGLILTPDLHMRQDNFGRIIAGGDFGISALSNHEHQTATALFSKVKSMFASASKMELENYGVGYRPMPADGLPIIGPAENVSGLYIAVMHSGITLAALVGRLAAQEISSGTPAAELEPYRLARFNDPTP
jgi:glycine/D-amino acid oxidase-like deaminating enzyme